MVLDLGSLFHCCMEFINILCAMEVIVKGKMIRGNEAAVKAGFKEKLAFEVHQDEDVLFWWSNLLMLPMWTMSVLYNVSACHISLLQ